MEAQQSGGTKKCRFCGEDILVEAKKCKHCGEWLEGGSQLIKNPKNKIVAFILAFFMGGFGAHKFYLGKPGQGILYLLFVWTAIPTIISIFEGLIYLTKNDDDFARLYGFASTSKASNNTVNNNSKISTLFLSGLIVAILVVVIVIIINTMESFKEDEVGAVAKIEIPKQENDAEVENADDKKPAEEASAIKKIQNIVKGVSAKSEVTIWDTKGELVKETSKPPYEVIVNAGSGDIANCGYAKNVAFEIMKKLYTDSVVKDKISRVKFTSWGHLSVSVGGENGVKTDWNSSGQTNFWIVMMKYKPYEDETGALSKRTWGKEIGSDCK